jgi:hypothetical protein
MCIKGILLGGKLLLFSPWPFGGKKCNDSHRRKMCRMWKIFAGLILKIFLVFILTKYCNYCNFSLKLVSAGLIITLIIKNLNDGCLLTRTAFSLEWRKTREWVRVSLFSFVSFLADHHKKNKTKYQNNK